MYFLPQIVALLIDVQAALGKLMDLEMLDAHDFPRIIATAEHASPPVNKIATW
jgi:hypothetical protein